MAEKPDPPPTHVVEFTAKEVRALLLSAVEQKGIKIPRGVGARFSAELLVDDDGNVRLEISFTRGKPRLRVIRGGAAG